MKNIMLIFISDIKNKIDESKYRINNREIVTMHTAESAVAELYNEVGKIDKIFAFVTKEVEEEKELVLADGTIVRKSILDFFKVRISKYIDMEDIVSCHYSADKDIENSLDNIAFMAQKVLSATAGFNKEKITIHADMTGGFRSASMMMLGIMRFLEYSNFKLGKVLYSNWARNREFNWVENAEGVYRFFDLVAGGKEFVHYGSVKEIMSYFAHQNNLSSEGRTLIMAMRDFSENIKLCHYGNFMKAITNLKEAIVRFENISEIEENIDDKLLKIMVPTIRKEYRGLLEAADDLSIIEWCVKREYLQQAMTLYTELVPEYIFEKKLLFVLPQVKEKFENNYKAYTEKDAGSKDFYAFTSWLSEDKLRMKIEETVVAKYSKVFEMLKKNKFNIEATEAALNGYKYACDDKDVLKYLENGYVKVSCDNSAFTRIIATLRAIRKTDEPCVSLAENMDLAYPLMQSFLADNADIKSDNRNVLASKFLNYCSNQLNEQQIRNFFDIKFDYTKEYRMEIRWHIIRREYGKAYGSCLKSIDVLKDIIIDYNWIKFERNASNHARKEVVNVTAANIEEKILDGIKKMREVDKIAES